MSITVLVEWQVKPNEMATAKALLQETFATLGNYPDAGVRLCFIQDNNGNLIEFVTPLEANVSSLPPQ